MTKRLTRSQAIRALFVSLHQGLKISEDEKQELAARMNDYIQCRETLGGAR